ncbi:MAG: DNA replication/repair protein RecF [Lachnospira sp.]|nr:DNA replication/repair protein RecF [Lachnospira sp.]
MIIESAELKDFRNYEYLKIALSPSVNIFYGDNAQGKTNILEALSVAATSRSHRGAKDREMIRIGQSEAHIKLFLDKHGMRNRIDVHLRSGSAKGIAVNGIPVRRMSEIFGMLNLVFFSPEDLDIIREGPAVRRRFMDMELSQIDGIYLNQLLRYNKVLQNRNRILKTLSLAPSKADEATLSVLDEQLALYGETVIAGRKKFISRISPIAGKIHADITGGQEHLQIVYLPDSDSGTFADRLAAGHERDLRFGQTGEGPHHDDLGFLINERDVKHFGSQGQKRTAALSVKLAEIELVKSVIHDDPVLLLDDVLSELDRRRQEYLLASISRIQTIITCTGIDEFVRSHTLQPEDRQTKVFYVEKGKVIQNGK